MAADQAPVMPMRLVATWEVDRSATGASVPRTLSLKLTRLIVPRAHDSELTSVVIAVRMQGTKRTLRTNDVSVVVDHDKVDQDLDISFNIQYPHFLKKNNGMLLMLQRRKKYKHRPMPGFKTLAIGTIDLSEVMQFYSDQEMVLYSESEVFARVQISGVLTTPVEVEEKPREAEGVYSDEDEDDLSTDGSESEGNPLELDESGHHHPPAQESKLRLKVLGPVGASRFHGRPTNLTFAERQRKLKQKIGTMLKKFKLQEEAGGADRASQSKEIESLIEELENFSDDSIAGLEGDSVSIKSTPKPSLRPFFASGASREQLPTVATAAFDTGISEESKDSADSCQDAGSDQGGGAEDEGLTVLPTSSRPLYGRTKSHDKTAFGEKLKRMAISTSAEPLANSNPAPTEEPSSSSRPVPALTTLLTTPRGSVAAPVLDRQASCGPTSSRSATSSTVVAMTPIPEQILVRMPPEESRVPSHIILMSHSDVTSPAIMRLLQQQESLAFTVSTYADIKMVLSNLLLRIQRFCNTNNVAPGLTKVLLLGLEVFVSRTLRVFTELLSQKNSSWLQYLKFYCVAPGTSTSLMKFLANGDQVYASSLFDQFWRDLWDRSHEIACSPQEGQEILCRLRNYLDAAPFTVHLPIAEAMLQCGSSNGSSTSGGESSQIFVPFLLEVRVGTATQFPFDPADAVSSPTTPREAPTYSSLAGGVGSAVSAGCQFSSGGSAPNDRLMKKDSESSPPSSPYSGHHAQPEPFDLQLEYWTAPLAKRDSGGDPSLRGDMPSIGTAGSGPSSASKRDSHQPVKVTMKTGFRQMVVTRVGGIDGSSLCLNFTKEKKQQKMFQKLTIKNKEKVESEPKTTTVKSITRLICSARQNEVLKVSIDGVEWPNVKFFQISSQWPTHVKYFPVALWTTDIIHA